MRTDRGYDKAAPAKPGRDRPVGEVAGPAHERPDAGAVPAGCGTRGGLTIVVVGLVALAIRLVHVLAVLDLPTTRHLVGDAHGYYQWAQRIATGDILGGEAFYQAPLYPYTLAAVLFVVGGGVTALLVTQAVWGAIGAALLALATRKRFGAAASMVAGLMAAVYGPAVFFDGVIQKASQSFLLISGLVWLLAGARDARRWPRRMAVGVVLGLLILTRENTIVWAPLLLGWSVWSGGATSFRRMMLLSAAFLVGLALVLVPVGMRNAVVAGEFSVSTFQAGPNFYIGNSKAATGRYVPLVRGHETPEFERQDATELAERAQGRPLSARAVSQYWMGRAWHDIAAAPGRWLRLIGLKLALVLSAYEIADVESLYVVREASPVLAGVAFVWHFGTLFPLAVAGLWLTRSRWRALWIEHALLLSMVVAVALFYVMARYRFPLVPLLIPFAATGAVGLFEFFRSTITKRGRIPSRGDARPVRRGADLAGNETIQSSEADQADLVHGHTSSGGRDCSDPNRARQEAASDRTTKCTCEGTLAGSRYSHGKEYFLAGVFAMVALVATNLPLVDEGRLDALSFMNYGVAYAAEGSLVEAEAMFRRSVAEFSDSPEAQANLAQVLALTERYEQAIPHYEAALDVVSDLPGIYYNLGVAYEHVGQTARARAAFQRAIEVDPGDADARAALSRLSAGLREGL